MLAPLRVKDSRKGAEVEKLVYLQSLRLCEKVFYVKVLSREAGIVLNLATLRENLLRKVSECLINNDYFFNYCIFFDFDFQ
jgi:hypothetical protein